MAKRKDANEGTDTGGSIWTRRPWNTERKSTFPAELRSAEGILRTPQLTITSDPAEALRRIVVACGGPESVTVSIEGLPQEQAQHVAEAALDTFNGQLALDAQKTAAEAVEGKTDKEGAVVVEPVTDPDEVQAILDGFREAPNQRRMGETGGGVKEAAKVGRQVKEVAKTASEEDLAVLRRLGLA